MEQDLNFKGNTTENSPGMNPDCIKDAETIMAFALIKHLFNEGKISEVVYRNIKQDTMKKISVVNKELL